jgi:ATP adenylyltransferase
LADVVDSQEADGAGGGDLVGVQEEPGLRDGAADLRDRPGVPDGVERLWMPHRLQYIRAEKPSSAEAGDHCPFCRVPALPDDEALIVRRGKLVYAVLNLYPYSSGHLLICPYRHVADYPELTDEETFELAALTQQGMHALRAAFAPHGFNLGMNQGAIAGAGIVSHLHQHIVPRWGGDSNFMPIIGNARVVPQLLPDTRAEVAENWPG